MSCEEIKPEGFWEEISVWLDRKFNRTVEVECDFCHKKIKTYRTFYKKYGKSMSCSEACARAVLYH